MNCAIKIETALEPFQFLDKLQSIQRKAGRLKDSIRFGPRILDIDIILYDDLIINSPQLTIPHREMHKRRFVLQPLCDIDPKIIHPIFKQNILQLLEKTDLDGQRIIQIK